MKLTGTPGLQQYIDAIVTIKSQCNNKALVGDKSDPVSVTSSTTLKEVTGLEQFFHPFTAIEHRPKLKGRLKSCYKWSLVAAMNDPNMLYCEGYAMSDTLGIPLIHAWCVDKTTGAVHDPTWKRKYRGIGYVGLPMQLDFVTDFVCKAGYYGVLENMWLHRDMNCPLYDIVHPSYYDKVFNPSR